jgi:hypothetical protein
MLFKNIIGMYDSAFWLSWILTYLIPFTIINIVIVIVMQATEFFKTATLSIVFFFLFEIFSIVTIIFGMMFSTFFQKSKSAGAAIGSFFSIASLIYFLATFLPRSLGASNK